MDRSLISSATKHRSANLRKERICTEIAAQKDLFSSSRYSIQLLWLDLSYCSKQILSEDPARPI